MVLPHEKKIEIGGEEITVRDLPWPVMKQFMDMLSQHLQAIGTKITKPEEFFDQLTTVTTNASELSEFLVSRAIHLEGNGKLNAADWLKERSATEFLTLLEATLAVVFNDEFIRLGKAVTGRLEAAFALGTATGVGSRKHVISSSGKDGPSAISSGSPSPS